MTVQTRENRGYFHISGLFLTLPVHELFDVSLQFVIISSVILFYSSCISYNMRFLLLWTLYLHMELLTEAKDLDI